MKKTDKPNDDLNETIKAVMKGNYKDSDIKEMSLWIDSVLINEEVEVKI